MSFPHVCGDGPGRKATSRPCCMFSPRVWGWSDNLVSKKTSKNVFPTRVGMGTFSILAWLLGSNPPTCILSLFWGTKMQIQEKKTGDRSFTFSDRKHLALLMQRDCIGKRYGGVDFSSVSYSKDIDGSLLYWIKNPRGFLLLLGGPGTGKTHFCAAAIHHLAEKFKSIRYFNEPDLFNRVRSVIGKGDYLKEVELVADSDLFILDDFGSTGINDWRREVFFHLIDIRYKNEAPTIITSNLRKEDVNGYLCSKKANTDIETGGYGASNRVYSRLFDEQNTIVNLHSFGDIRMGEGHVQ